MNVSPRPEHVDLIYQAATDPDRWVEFIDAVSGFLGTTGGNVLIKAADEFAVDVFAATHVSPAQIDVYNSGIGATDSTIAACYALPAEQAYLSTDGPPTRKEYVRTQFYEEWACDTPIFWGIGGFFMNRGARAGVIGWHREEAREKLDTWVKPYVTGLMPHIKRSFMIHEHYGPLEAEVFGRQTNLGDPSVGHIVLNTKGKTLFVTADAESMLNSAYIDIRDSRIHARLPGLEVELGRWLSAVLQADPKGATAMPPGFLVHRGEGRKPLYLRMHRFDSGVISDRLNNSSRILLQLRDPERLGDRHVTQIQQAFALTVGEARLAIAIASGKSLSVYAEAQALSIQTVRTYLKRTLRKVGVHSQAELVGAVLYSLF